MRRYFYAATAAAVIAFVTLGSSTLHVAQAATATTAATTTQLPRNVRPTHYDLSINPDAASLTFKAKIAIAIEVLQPSTSITLNAIDLKFASVRLSGAAQSAPFSAPQIEIDATQQTATFRFDKPIPNGSYQLALDYSGNIGTQPAGLFALDYDTAAGRKRALYTQFEIGDARRVLPCWDEPEFKATFQLQATVPREQMAISNTPIAKQTELDGGRALVRFQPSPKMSTYLLFFALGEFDRATTTVEGVELGVVTQKGAGSQAAFALESSARVLQEYHDYFGVPYPLAKLDNIAAPGNSQFFSAMENWGAIFTFERVILLDPSISTQVNKHEAFSVAAHEIAHQWFGNLVTMRWWDDLWLNEGFASWMDSRTTARIHPEWNDELSAVSIRERAMERDSLATTHPVVQHVETVDQANLAFDAITYSKGEAVIRMLESYIGEDAWRAGVRRYIKKYAYDSTVSDDLWREIEAASGQPITAIAHDFTLQPGVPMIRVDDAACTGQRTTLQLTQIEYSKDQPHRKALTWRVPVILKPLGAATAVRQLLTDGKTTVTVPGCAPVIINAGQSGYYRTLYSPAQFAGITKQFVSIATIDQLGILSDSWSLGLAAQQPVTDFLDLVEATPASAAPELWQKISTVFNELNEYYSGDSSRQALFRKFAIARLTPVFSQVGWSARANEPDAAAILRNRLIETLGAFGDPVVNREAQRQYASQASVALPAPLRRSILAVVARHADAKTWDQLHAAALAEKTPLIKSELYSLLATTEDESLARRALALAITAEPGETNSAEMISTVAHLHPDLAFDFAIEHLATVNAKLDEASRSRYFPALASRSAEPTMLGKIKAYASANLPAGSHRDADTAAATVADRIRVRSQQLPKIDAWLARNQ